MTHSAESSNVEQCDGKRDLARRVRVLLASFTFFTRTHGYFKSFGGPGFGLGECKRRGIGGVGCIGVVIVQRRRLSPSG